MKTKITDGSPLPSHRLHLLEGLRAFMAWWVVVYHYLFETGFGDGRMMSVSIGRLALNGGYAVDVFIILSGFVITHLLFTQKTSYLEFIWRRFFRLYPLFLVCIVVGFLTFHPTFSAYERFGDKLHLTSYQLPSWREHQQHMLAYFSLCLTMLHGAVPNAWLPAAQAAFDPPSWSISLEWQFYLLFPLVLFAWKKRPRLTFALVAVVVGFRHFYNVGDWGSFLPQRAEFFLVGILSYHLFRLLVRLQTTAKQTVPWTASIIVLLVLLIEPLRDLVMRPYQAEMGDWAPLVIWTFALALLIETQGPAPSRFASRIERCFLHPVAQFLGRVSYSTYLLHYFFIYAVMGLLVASNIARNKYISLAAMLLIAAPLTVIASALSYRYIEKPGIELGRRLLAKRNEPSSFPPPNALPATPDASRS